MHYPFSKAQAPTASPHTRPESPSSQWWLLLSAFICAFFFFNHFLHVQYFFHFLCWFLYYSQRPAYASFSLYLCTCPSLFPSLSVPRRRSNTVPGCWMNERLTVTDIHMLFQFFLPNLKQWKHFAHKRTLYSISFVFSPLICNFLLLGHVTLQEQANHCNHPQDHSSETQSGPPE